MKRPPFQAGLRRRRSAGVGIVTAIFLLVVIAGLIVAMVSVLTTQQTESAQDEQGARAYQAARAGIEWALYIAQPTANPVPVGLNCPNTYSFGFQALTSLSGFRVTVTCGSITTLNGVKHYSIRATSCNEPVGSACPNAVSPSANYVQRVVEVQL